MPQNHKLYHQIIFKNCFVKIGFTLGFGAMFSKIWRVHRLSTKNKADSSKAVRFFIESNAAQVGRTLRWDTGDEKNNIGILF